mgnify:CR=1 FL=1
MAAYSNDVNPVYALLALVVAVSLQVGVNYANDYSDGVRGTDDERVGPMRLTGSGAAPATGNRHFVLMIQAPDQPHDGEFAVVVGRGAE